METAANILTLWLILGVITNVCLVMAETHLLRERGEDFTKQIGTPGPEEPGPPHLRLPDLRQRDGLAPHPAGLVPGSPTGDDLPGVHLRDEEEDHHPDQSRMGVSVRQYHEPASVVLQRTRRRDPLPRSTARTLHRVPHRPQRQSHAAHHRREHPRDRPGLL